MEKTLNLSASRAPSTRDGVDKYLQRAEQIVGDSAPTWLQELRAQGRTQFDTMGFPTPRDEEWKYTDVSAITHWPQSETASEIHLNGSANDLHKYLHGADTVLVFLNGQFSPELSKFAALPDGAIVTNLASQWENPLVQQYLSQHVNVHQDAFGALNTAMLQDGALVYVPADVKLEAVEVLHFTLENEGATSVFPRALIVLENGAQATVTETFAGRGRYASLGTTEIFAGENAHLDHYRAQWESEQAWHIGNLHVLANRGAHCSSHNLNVGALVARHTASAVMNGENIHVTLNGLVLARGQQIIDNHTAMDHAQPHCTSLERYIHILDGQSTAVFNGKIFVRIDAQKTDAVQSNRSLLLSPDATVNTKPQLEIFADDVKCTHGATIGQLDEAALFYLRARGISESEARGLLTYAFAEAVLENVQIEPLRERLEAELLSRL